MKMHHRWSFSIVFLCGCAGNYPGLGEQAPSPSSSVSPPVENPNTLVIRWDPPAGYTQIGAVVLEDAWAQGKSLCELRPVAVPPLGTVFTCAFETPSRAVLHFGVKRVDSRSPSGVAWVFDRSCDGFWSGCGKDFGTVTLWKGNSNLFFALEPNNSQRKPYYNGVLKLR